jgi:inorganic pyrophosphatase
VARRHPRREHPREFNAIIEIPFGSSVKYELDKISGLHQARSRALLRGVLPANYGFIRRRWPRTMTRSDVLVLCQETVVPLTLMHARTIGLMTDDRRGKKDHKIIAVATEGPGVQQLQRSRRDARRTG